MKEKNFTKAKMFMKEKLLKNAKIRLRKKLFMKAKKNFSEKKYLFLRVKEPPCNVIQPLKSIHNEKNLTRYTLPTKSPGPLLKICMELETCDLKNNVIQTLELARRRVKILFLVYNVMM